MGSLSFSDAAMHRILNPNAPCLSGMGVLLGLLWHRWFQWQLVASPAKHGCRDLGSNGRPTMGDHGAKMCKKGILPRLENILFFSYEVRYWYFLWWIFQPVLELLEDTGITLRPGLLIAPSILGTMPGAGNSLLRPCGCKNTRLFFLNWINLLIV